MARKKTPSDTGTTARNQKGTTLTLGAISLPINMFSVKKSTNDEKFESVCPICAKDDEMNKTEVFHLCPADDKHGPFKYADVLRAKVMDDKSLQVVGRPEELRAAKSGDVAEEEVDQGFSLVAHDATDIETSTYPVGVSYVIRPVPGAPSPLFPLLLAKVGHDGRINMGDDRVLTLIGRVTMKGSDKLMQLRTWNNQLVAQELCRPEDLHDYQPVAGAPDERFSSLLEDCIDLAEVDFDPAHYEDEARKRLAEFAAQRLENGPDADVIIMPTRPVVTAASEDDMLAALAASVAAAKKAKSRKKAS